MLRPWCKITYLLAAFLFPTIAPAADYASCLLGFRALARPQHDTAVELEMTNNDWVLMILTTETGRLDAIFDAVGAKQVSQAVLSEFGVSNFAKLRQLEWDSLNANQKRSILRHATAMKKTSFFEDRRLPGIRVRDEVTLAFPEETTFLGITYPAGKHQIQLCGTLCEVEYGGIAQTPKEVELHFRANQSAGTMSKQARIFQRALGHEATSQHVHIVAPIPVKKLKTNVRLESTRIAEFYRRANLVAEMRAIVETSSAIRSIQMDATEEVIQFASLTPENLGKVADYFVQYAEGNVIDIGDSLKPAFVGFRGHDTYDQPGLFGFEVRDIDTRYDIEENKKLLDSLQHSLVTEEYGVPPERIQTWLQRFHSGSSAQRALETSWYNQPLKALIENARPEIKTVLAQIPSQRLEAYIRDNQSIKMLLYDWSQDPLLFDQPGLLERIRREQLDTLIQVFHSRTSSSSPSYMGDFLEESGIYEIFNRSIGG